MLEKSLELVGDPEFKDIIVIQAGPGAGKSSFTLQLANALLEEELQPIVIRFRDLRLSQFGNVGELLDDAIRIGFSDEDSPHPDCEIISNFAKNRSKFRESEIPRLVMILDGWDEMSLTGNASLRDQLTSWLPKLRQYFTERRPQIAEHQHFPPGNKASSYLADLACNVDR